MTNALRANNNLYIIDTEKRGRGGRRLCQVIVLMVGLVFYQLSLGTNIHVRTQNAHF